MKTTIMSLLFTAIVICGGSRLLAYETDQSAHYFDGSWNVAWYNDALSDIDNSGACDQAISDATTVLNDIADFADDDENYYDGNSADYSQGCANGEVNADSGGEDNFFLDFSITW